MAEASVDPNESHILTENEMKESHEAPEAAGVTRMPVAGEAILTSDGKNFGIVRQTHGGYIEIDREGDPDYWLSDAYVVANDGDRLILRVPMSEAESHRLRRPGLESMDGRLVGLGTSQETDQEALRTRERMEAELLAQRGGRMDTGLRR